MVKVRQDLTGMTFGRLTVIKQVDDRIDINGRHYARYLCECSCEEHNQVIVDASNLKKANGTKSCGCLIKESVINANKKYNQYDLSGEYGIGYCSNTGSEFYFDLEDYDKIKDFCWCEYRDAKTGYRVLRTHRPKTSESIVMTTLLGCKYFDHINRNTLDNRKCNLREATTTENAQNRDKYKNNTSGFTGVGWHKNTSKWVAYITVDGKLINLGYFVNKNDAIIARLEAECKYFGEFAPQQHLFEQYKINKENK